MTTDEQVIEQRLDLEMLKRPHLWPGKTRLGGPLVHLKRPERPIMGASFPETAVCMFFADDPEPYVVAVWLDDNPLVIDSTRTKKFADAEGIVDAGWKVD